MDAKHVFIVNPAAGASDQTAPVAAVVSELMRRRGLDYEILITEAPKHATTLAREAAERLSDRPLRFYACGGDGTLNEVVTAVADLPGAECTHYPIGSGNDYIKLFGGDLRRFKNLEELIDGDVLEMDVIRSDCGLSANILSVGVDARVAAGMQKYKRIPMLGGTAAYNISTVENVLRGLHHPYGVEIDGEHYDGRYTLILAANGRYYGGGVCPVPNADPQDGLLDILMVRDVSRLKAAKVIGAYKIGQYTRYPELITHLQAKTMTIYAPDGKPMTVNLDGEIAEVSRMSLRVEPRRLRFVVPHGMNVVKAERTEG